MSGLRLPKAMVPLILSLCNIWNAEAILNQSTCQYDENCVQIFYMHLCD